MFGIPHVSRYHAVLRQPEDRRSGRVLALRTDIRLLSTPLVVDRSGQRVSQRPIHRSRPRVTAAQCRMFLASHTLAGTMWCSDSRQIDDRVGYSPSVPIYGCSAHRSLSTIRGSRGDRYIDIEPALRPPCRVFGIPHVGRYHAVLRQPADRRSDTVLALRTDIQLISAPLALDHQRVSRRPIHR